MIEFPARLWEARHSWNLVGGVATPGRTGTGAYPVIRLDGGGLWRATLSDITVYDKAGVNLWRAIRTIADGGAAPIIVPRHDEGSAPWPIIGGKQFNAYEATPHADGALFSDGSGYHQAAIVAHAVNAAALRATSLRIQMVQGSPLLGGEVFSIHHTTMGWRMYEIGTVYDNGDGSFDVTFLCPLREAVTAGTAIEFDRPRCMMRLESPGGMDLELQPPWWGRPSVTFIEAFFDT